MCLDMLTTNGISLIAMMSISYYFLNLHSGKHFICNNWTVLSMPNEVINTIHQLAMACNEYKGKVFTDKDINVINDENEDTEDNAEITEVDEECSPTEEIEEN